MPIIGKLLKKTTEFAYKRTFNKGKEYSFQLQTLSKLLEKAKKTNFGKKYDFTAMLNDPETTVEQYQQAVPLTDYDQFYTDWLEKSMEGEKDHTWPGRIRHYALSSGTTGSPSKRVPITPQMIRSFQKTSMKQIATLHSMDLPESFFNSSILIIGGSSKLESRPTHIEGDLSGILKKYTSIVVSPFTKPSKKIAKIKDWNEKIDSMVEKAAEWDIGVVAGVPSWCIMLVERIVERYQLKSIHDIWPNFRVYVHGGVFVEPYREKLDRLLGKQVFLLDTYLASEGYFAYQVHPSREGMRLLLDNGVFFEFIPFNSSFFDERGNLKDRYTALSISQVVEGVDYALIISTNAGLWRYVIGDLVRFTNVEDREIKITGRIKQFLSLCGEHLSLDNINVALNRVAKKHGLTVAEFCLFASAGEQRHFWYIGTDEPVDRDTFMKDIDTELGNLNDDYRSVRKYSLNDPVLEVLPTQVFYDYLGSIGKLGSQHKFPRVLNATQAESWVNFLEKR